MSPDTTSGGGSSRDSLREREIITKIINEGRKEENEKCIFNYTINKHGQMKLKGTSYSVYSGREREGRRKGGREGTDISALQEDLHGELLLRATER